MNARTQLSCMTIVGATAVWAADVRADCDDPLLDPTEVLELHLRVTQAEWEALTFDVPGPPELPECEQGYPYHEIGFRCGDDPEWLTIGARHKRGDQRGLDTEEKPPLKLDFNRYVMGQRWPAALGDLGFRRLSLNNGQEDNPGGILTALLTEHLSWRLMRTEVPAGSQSVYARLWVHFEEDESIEYHGLYIVIEDIDRTALKRRFGGEGSGTLLKTTSGTCRDQVEFDDGLPNAATEGFDAWWNQDPNGDYPQGWWGETEQALYTDELLRQEAVRDILANGGDTVLGNNNSNFYSWDDPTDKRHYIPWDLDDVFRPMPQNVPFNTPIEASCGQLGNRTRCHAPELRARYLEIACQLINGTLEVDRVVAEFDAVDALIRPIIPEETDPVWGGVDPLDGGPNNTYQAEYVRIREWIQNRIPFVRAQIEAQGFACPEGCTEGEAQDCAYLTCAGVRSCVDGLWTPCEVAPEPGDAICNGLDDDCDLQIDEDCVDSGTTGGGDTTGGADTSGSASATAGSEAGSSGAQTGVGSATLDTTAGTSTGDGAAQAAGDGGCGCNSAGPDARAGLPVVGLALLGRRRRRRSAR